MLDVLITFPDGNVNKKKGKLLYMDGICTNYRITKTGEVYCENYKFKNKTKRLKKSLSRKKKYYYIQLSHPISKKRYRLRLHRLVALAYKKIPKKYKKLGLGFNDLEVNHKDGNGLNNNVSNLEWVTSKDNKNHAVENHLILSGEDKPNVKYSEKLIRNICKELVNNKLTPSEIMNKYNIYDRNLIYDIKRKNTWKYIVSDYDFTHYSKKSKRKVKKGDSSNFNKYPEEIVHYIANDIVKNELTPPEIARKYGVKPDYVRKIRDKKIWKEVLDEYDFTKYNQDGRKYNMPISRKKFPSK